MECRSMSDPTGEKTQLNSQERPQVPNESTPSSARRAEVKPRELGPLAGLLPSPSQTPRGQAR